MSDDSEHKDTEEAPEEEAPEEEAPEEEAPVEEAPAEEASLEQVVGQPDRESWASRFFKIRDEPSILGRMAIGGAFLGLLGAAWFVLTWGDVPELRLVSPVKIPSPVEVFSRLGMLIFKVGLGHHLLVSLTRVLEGFGLAIAIGLPLGILAGTFRRVGAFIAPLVVFGRNVPMAAMIPLTILWFGTDELQKVMFIFIATVSFVIFDTTQIVMNVPQEYLDTASTLGASRRQIVFKVLLPLSLPEIFNSLRLLFGLGFGYIILAEIVNQDAGLGKLIMTAQSRGGGDGGKEIVYLCLLIIALLAYAIDRLLYWIGTQAFPYRFHDK